MAGKNIANPVAQVLSPA
ncbi:hypothetical protein ACNKHW_00485 [Shigella flexneri]